MNTFDDIIRFLTREDRCPKVEAFNRKYHPDGPSLRQELKEAELTYEFSDRIFLTNKSTGEQEMPLNASEPEKRDFDPSPEGLHLAVCYAVIETGTHFDAKYDKDVHEVLFMWELVGKDLRIEIERDGVLVDLPRAISRRYTISLHAKSNLRKMLEGWRGKSFTPDELEGFDVSQCLGVSCQIQVIHNRSDDGSKTWANVNNVLPTPKGVKHEPENTPTFFSFADNGATIPEHIPKWVKEEIETSNEYNKLINPPTPLDAPNGNQDDDFGPPLDDDFPF